MNTTKLFVNICPSIEDIKKHNLQETYMYFTIWWKKDKYTNPFKSLKCKYPGAVSYSKSICIPVYTRLLDVSKLEVFLDFIKDHLDGGNDTGEIVFRRLASFNTKGSKSIYEIYFDIFDFVYLND